MERPNPSTGVTASAIVTFVGSSLVILLALLTISPILLVRLFPSASARAQMPPYVTSTVEITALFYLALASWGFATGVGLLRLRAWARASILVFSCLEVLSMVCAAFGVFVASHLVNLPNRPPDFETVMRIGAVALGLLALVGVWWLVLFNLKSVRAQFDESGVAGTYGEGSDTAQARAMRSNRPLSISVIAILYLLALPSMVLGLVRGYPAMLGGYVFEGASARLIYVLSGAVSVSVGIGLLKLKPWARLCAIGLSVFYFVSSVLMAFIPGSTEKMLASLAKMDPRLAQPYVTQLMSSTIRFAWIFGCVGALVFVWFLVRNKAAFTQASAAASADPAA